MAIPIKKIVPGAYVAWSSQAGGWGRTKVGIVQSILPAEETLFCPIHTESQPRSSQDRLEVLCWSGPDCAQLYTPSLNTILETGSLISRREYLRLRTTYGITALVGYWKLLDKTPTPIGKVAREWADVQQMSIARGLSFDKCAEAFIKGDKPLPKHKRL